MLDWNYGNTFTEPKEASPCLFQMQEQFNLRKRNFTDLTTALRKRLRFFFVPGITDSPNFLDESITTSIWHETHFSGMFTI